MTYLQSIILGIIEGITEFLPISSTGHLILTSNFLSIPETEFLKTFEIAIQFGAILSVVWLYKEKLFKSIEIWKKIITAFVPTAVIGLLLYKTFKEILLGNINIVLWSLFLGGIFLIFFEKIFKKEEAVQSIEEMSYKQAGLIGVFQSLAIIPGVSRSAATILGGLGLGVDRKTITEFSFLLAVPTMMSATFFDIIQNPSVLAGDKLGILTTGFIVSFIIASMAIKWLLKYIKGHDFSMFGYYRILLVLIIWITLR